MANSSTKPKQIPKLKPVNSASNGRPSRFRAFSAVVFGLLFLFFASIAIISHWTERTLTDTDNFSQIIGPLADEQSVKTLVSREITDAIIEKGNQSELANGLLGLPPNTPLSPQVSLQLEQKIDSSVNKILESEAFNSLWQNGSRQVHAQLINILSDDGSDAIATINVRPQLQTLIDMVEESELKLGDDIKLEADAGQIKLTSDKLADARTAYRQFTKIDTLALVLALFCGSLAILVANNRLKTLRKLVMALALSCGFSAVFIFIATHVSLVPADKVQSDFIRTILSGALDGLYKLNLYILGGALVVTAVSTLALKKNWPKGLKK